MPPKKTASASKITAAKTGAAKPKATTKSVTASKKAASSTKTSAAKSGASKAPAKASTSKSTAKSTPKVKAAPSPENVAATKIQRTVRGWLAQLDLNRLKQKKRDYDEMIEQLQKQAWLDIIERQREADEIARQKEEEIRRRKKQEQKWRKDLLEAAFDGDLDSIRTIIQEATDATRKNSSLTGEGLERIVNKVKTNLIHCEDANENSTLSEACAGGDISTINFFLENGASVNKPAHFHRTPLYRAAFGGHLDAIALLLRHGCDPRIPDCEGVTPQQVSASADISEVLETWDISDTEVLLLKISEEEEMRSTEKQNEQKAEREKMEGTLKDLEDEYSTQQKMLQKAYEELNKRISEHDNCVAEGFERPDVTLQAIHDAEEHLVEAQREEKKCRDKLSTFRLEARERQQGDDGDDAADVGIVKCHIKEMDDVLMRDVGNKIKDSGRWPLLVDSSSQAVTFLKYRDTNYLNTLNPKDMESQTLRLALLGAIRYGKILVLDMMEMNLIELIEKRFDDVQPQLFEQLMNRSLLKDRAFTSLIRSTDGKEYSQENFVDARVDRFALIVVSKLYEVPEQWKDEFYVIKIVTPDMS